MIKEETYFKHYKKFMLIPVLLIILSFLILANSQAQKDDIINKDISLRGGITAIITLDKEVDIPNLEAQLKQELNVELKINLREFLILNL